MRDLLRTKSVDAILSAARSEHGLRRALGPWSLTLLGIGAIIGAGIFSTVGTAAAGADARPGAGPGLVLSFVLTAIACGFAALCYAELASMVPVSGSAYTYTYATLGELVAWIIGWDLIIEYGIGNAAVAISWSGYFQELVRGLGLDFPAWLGLDYRSAAQAAERVAGAQAGGLDPVAALGPAAVRMADALAAAPRIGGLPIVLNLPAAGIVMALTWILVIGIRESAWVNSLMVAVKLVIIAGFVVLGAFYVKPENWTPFAPNGFHGIATAAAIVFFAYIGFDAVSTAAEETRNPARDLPIAIIGSLVVCTVIYIGVAAVLTGLLPWSQLATAEPLATAFSNLGMNWAAFVISVGAVFATTSVLLVFQLGQPRIFFSMARDGLLPAWAARVHRRYQTPYVTTWITGIVVAVFAAVANLNELVELTNIGTLFAFLLVCAGVTVLRYKDPGRARPFRVPLGPWVVPAGGAACCVFLMVYLPPASWWRFAGWLVLGASVYAGYGYSRSLLGRSAGRSPATPMPLKVAAVACLVAATGLFVVPHGAGLRSLLAGAGDPVANDHGRALAGLLLFGTGVAVAVLGFSLRRRP